MFFTEKKCGLEKLWLCVAHHITGQQITWINFGELMQDF
jgi:hypothetical protein